MSKRHIISASATLREAFAALNLLSGGNMNLFAVDEEKRLMGSLTDGDLRRAIIAGHSLDEHIGNVCHADCLRIDPATDPYRVVREARMKGISLLPLTDDDGKIESLIDLRIIKAILPIDAVLMAGGRGERLRPLTLDCPKPLLKVGDKPIIDYNVDELIANGVDNIFVTVNYLKEQIIQHFTGYQTKSDSSMIREINIRCISEPRRLGTMGSLSLIPESEFRHDNILVMNSDLLTTLNFEQLYKSHVESGALLTIAAILYTVSVPYAILKCDGRRVKGLAEKPTYNYFANAGVYIMRREVMRFIPKGEYLDAPDLIENLIDAGKKVEYFPIDGTWIDIGSPDDYRYANELMAGARKL